MSFDSHRYRDAAQDEEWLFLHPTPYTLSFPKILPFNLKWYPPCISYLTPSR